MTAPAAIPSLNFEARLKGLSATSTKDGNWTKVEFQVHPDDDLSGMLKAGVNSRWMIGAALIGDDGQAMAIKGTASEQPVPGNPGTPKEKSRRVAAVMACQNEEFQIFTGVAATVAGTPDAEFQAAAYVRNYCGIKSRSELDTDPEAGKRWDDLWFQFTQRENIR